MITSNRTLKSKLSSGPWRQSGVTLIEMLVAMAISVIAITGMVLLMSSTLGNATDTIVNARLSNELRSAMMLMTRELRRANISDTYMTCISNGDYLCPDVSDSAVVSSGPPDEVSFSYERNGTTVTSAFRVANGALEVQIPGMNTGNGCDNGWCPLTDSEVLTIDTFTFEEAIGSQLTYTQEISPSMSQRTRKMRITLTGTICHARDSSDNCTEDTTRSVSNVVRIRNDVNFATPAP
jgi:prepilin-type N-terminal cleavage/methylation domain-containing protein